MSQAGSPNHSTFGHSDIRFPSNSHPTAAAAGVSFFVTGTAAGGLCRYTPACSVGPHCGRSATW